MRPHFLKKAIIIQARYDSTRLPGKVLKKIRNRIILDYVIDRLKPCKNIDDIILATTTNKKDDKIEKYAKEKKIKYYRGSEQNVLSRYYETARKYEIDTIIRITSDCPLIDYETVDEITKTHIDSSADYTSNVLKRTYPRGLDTEVFNFDVLEDSNKNADKDYQKEHVTKYITENPEKFKLHNVEAEGILRRPEIRITLDTIEDFKLIEKIILHFDDANFKAAEIIDFLTENPDLLEINKNVKQKEVQNN
jgi:spore coat polysaccharide biosynthesis protein SpsF